MFRLGVFNKRPSRAKSFMTPETSSIPMKMGVISETSLRQWFCLPSSFCNLYKCCWPKIFERLCRRFEGLPRYTIPSHTHDNQVFSSSWWSLGCSATGSPMYLLSPTLNRIFCISYIHESSNLNTKTALNIFCVYENDRVLFNLPWNRKTVCLSGTNPSCRT